MTPELLAQCLEHAQSSAPHEACGLFLWDGKNKAVYRPCTNIESEQDRFTIHPKDWADAEDRAMILGVVHSHPEGDLTPSPHDVAHGLRHGFPWWIVSTDGRWKRFQGRLALEGRPYAWGVQDCLTVIQDWHSIHGITIPDPARVPSYWEHGLDPYRDGLADSGFEVVNDELRAGDVLFFHSPVKHAGVYVGGGRFLHHREGHLSRSETLDGYWQKSLSTVVRAK